MSIYKQAVDHYGKVHQILKAPEELAELAAALIKYALALIDGENPTNADNVAEEVADVEIMLEQLKYALPSEIRRKAGRIKNEKINKLNAMIQKKAHINKDCNIKKQEI